MHARSKTNVRDPRMAGGVYKDGLLLGCQLNDRTRYRTAAYSRSHHRSEGIGDLRRHQITGGGVSSLKTRRRGCLQDSVYLLLGGFNVTHQVLVKRPNQNELERIGSYTQHGGDIPVSGVSKERWLGMGPEDFRALERKKTWRRGRTSLIPCESSSGRNFIR